MDCKIIIFKVEKQIDNDIMSSNFQKIYLYLIDGRFSFYVKKLSQELMKTISGETLVFTFQKNMK